MVRSTNGDPTATVEDIPQELLDRFCMFADVATLKSLRLANKAFNPAATKALFGHVEVLPTEESANKCLELISDAKLSNLVKNLAFRTAIDPEADNEDGENNMRDEMHDGLIRDENFDYWLPRPCIDVLSGLASLKELQSVSLTFSEHVNGESMDFASSAREEMPFRNRVFSQLLSSFKKSDQPKKFHQLSIKNLQDKKHPVFTTASFKRMLACLDSLSLQIATETHDAAPELEPELPELHEFFNSDLKTFLLEPVASNLRELKLYTTCGLNTHVYWGQYPSCDLRDVRFPKLEVLALGNFSFSYDWQLDWILSHSETLHTLVLDDCPIVIEGKTSSDMEHHHIVPETRTSRNEEAEGGDDDDEGYDDDDEGDEITWAYSGRWHTYFRRIKDSMTHLKHFGINCDQHSNSTEHDAFNIFKVGAKLSINRYRVFDSAGLTLPGHPYSGYVEDVDNQTGEPPLFDMGWGDDNDENVNFPATWKEDNAALEELLEVVRSRK